ncbi:MAG TPA: NUDIX hydrolase [Bdellovibrionales bacterium]|nr:NUDIX hydrolase [Bdellovibrionales bacterium]
MKPKWKILSSEEILKTKLIRFRVDKCELPDGRIMPRYYVLEFPEWANVVPVTEEGKIVLVEQYRHAIGEWHLEIPGGTTDHGEDTKRAALRELVEETGYAPEDIRLVGIHAPNPAMQNNRMHTYIAYNCKKIQEPTPDEFEDLRVVTVTVPELIDKIFKGEINHSIVIASILYALPALGFHLPRP